ncbi:sensor domain-containing phosphodiesterase [Parablastomonas sp. CN1-191]|uniref:sensor domain-containing phosphodiesterase n=1 Tax=Parablastomonas sp. CN1-191 TaxID=3400908 RepID=UPI003BF844D4
MVAHNPQSFASFVAPARGGAELVRHDGVDRILNAVRQHLGMEIAFVSRYVEGGLKELTHVDSDLDLPMGPGFRDPREDSYCWHIAEGRLPELIQDTADHPFTETMAITRFLPVGAHLNTPLRLSDGTLYGSFCCLSRQPDRTMTDRDVGVLRAFAALAAVQIEAALESDVQAAATRARIEGVLARRDLTVVQQPIHALATGLPVGAECLARFADGASRGPDAWFAEAAQVGMGVDLEMLAIELALASAAALPSGCYVSINASPDTVLSGRLEAALMASNTANIVVELTEHQQVADFAALKAALARIAGRARIAIDDVGAGYAGLRHLVELSPHLLKLDISLVRDIHKDVARRALTGAMVRFAAAIGSKLIAEGIECAEEAEVLAELGVDYGQGYHFARPMRVSDAARYLAA